VELRQGFGLRRLRHRERRVRQHADEQPYVIGTLAEEAPKRVPGVVWGDFSQLGPYDRQARNKTVTPEFIADLFDQSRLRFRC
jgi:hypothetical protein